MPLFLLLAFACTKSPADTSDTGDSETNDTDGYGEAALAFVNERLVGSFEGEWQMFGLNADDEAEEMYTWFDVIVGSNPHIDGDRAIVDIVNDLDGGDWNQTVEFQEGVYVAEDGGVGDYFMEVDSVITIVEEVEPDQWEFTSELAAFDLDGMENVDAENLLDGWKVTTKLVTWQDGWERHDVTAVTHVEYEVADEEPVTVEFTSMTGYHQKFE